MRKRGFDTRAIHEGQSEFHPKSMSVPIYQSVAYPFEDAQEAAAISAGDKPGFTYGRWDNPTVQVFEKRMAALEGAESAIATSSGMGAIFLLVHHLVQAGDEIVSSNRVYGGTFGLFGTGLPRMGAKVNWVTKPESLDAWKAAITPKTRFLFVESPSNPALFIGDIRALADLAHAHKIPLVVDNTICTPALQRPIERHHRSLDHQVHLRECLRPRRHPDRLEGPGRRDPQGGYALPGPVDGALQRVADAELPRAPVAAHGPALPQRHGARHLA